MRMLARAAAGRAVGAGHVMRCLALAEGVVERGGRAVLSADLGELAWIRPWAAGLGVELIPPTTTAADLSEQALGCDVVVIDDYAVASPYAEVAAAGAVLLNIEDGGYGRRRADVVVDSSRGAEHRSRLEDGSGVLLLGLPYAPIRSEVRAARRAPTTVPPSVRQVGIVMGGTDARGLTDRIADLIAAQGFGVTVPASGLGLYTRLADVHAVVSAAGTSALELCCVGIPTGVVEVADNQAENARLLGSAGLVTRLASLDDILERPAGFVAAVRDWLDDGPRLHRTAAAAQSLVDGLGVRRILDATERLLSGR